MLNHDLGKEYSYFPDAIWDFDTTYYWQLVPYNYVGDCASNSVFSFTTMPAATITSFGYVESCESLIVPQLPPGYLSWDQDGDGSSWLSAGTTNKYLRSNSNSTEASNDWLILPGVSMKQNATYSFHLPYRQGFNGRTVGMEIHLLSEPDPNSSLQILYVDDLITFTCSYWLALFDYMADATSVRFVGIRFYAQPNQGYLAMDNLRINESLIPVIEVYPLDAAVGVHNLPALIWVEPEVVPVGYILFLGTDNPPQQCN